MNIRRIRVCIAIGAIIVSVAVFISVASFGGASGLISKNYKALSSEMYEAAGLQKVDSQTARSLSAASPTVNYSVQTGDVSLNEAGSGTITVVDASGTEKKSKSSNSVTSVQQQKDDLSATQKTGSKTSMSVDTEDSASAEKDSKNSLFDGMQTYIADSEETQTYGSGYEADEQDYMSDVDLSLAFDDQIDEEILIQLDDIADGEVTQEPETESPASEETKEADDAESEDQATQAYESEAEWAASVVAVDTYPEFANGVLSPLNGCVYFNHHRETYYSETVLPGTHLNIPGRYVAEDGTIRDEDGYICVASSQLPIGTVIETSLGMGKVYDTGCSEGTIDLYVHWD